MTENTSQHTSQRLKDQPGEPGGPGGPGGSGEIVQAPAALRSPLAGIRARRAAAAKQLQLDLVVPRYDPPIYVRFRPVEQHEIEAGRKRVEKSKDLQVSLLVDAGILAKACIGIFQIDSTGRERSIDPDDLDGEWPRFDERLGQLLEEPPGLQSVDLVRALYLTDGDIIATAAQLGQWSGYRTDELDRATQGN